MLKSFRKKISNFKKNEFGVTAIYFGLAMPVFLGFSALAFDATMWFMERRVLQSTVDAAAMSAAYVKYRDGTDAAMLSAATGSASDNYFTVGGSNTLVVNSPPISGAYTADINAVQATMSMPGRGFFSSALGVGATTISTTATAAVVSNGEACLVALNETIDQALYFSGNNETNMTCGVASNSDSDQSIYVNGNVEISADPALSADGDIYVGGSATVDANTELRPDSGDIDDPYANLVVPNSASASACSVTFADGETLATYADSSSYITESGTAGNEIYTLEPGRYCGDFPISGKTVVLDGGFYILDAADFNTANGTNLTGDGVTIILTATAAADIGNLKITGGTIDLQAQSTDDLLLNPTDEQAFAGVVFYQDRRAIFSESPVENRVNGDSNITIDGGIYFPSQVLAYNGTTGTAATCTQVIASVVQLSGNSDTTVNNTTTACEELGARAAELKLVVLVE